MSSRNKVGSQVLELANHIGSFIEYWGFKEIHGRIWTLIFLAKEPVDANFLIENLNVSKALVSMSLKDLLYYNVILEVEKTGPSTQKYTFNQDIFGVIVDVLRQREAKMLIQIRGAVELLGRAENGSENSKVDRERLEKLNEMTIMADQFLSSMIALKVIDPHNCHDALVVK